jgi:putative SOS response-associated peptidase YedK
LLNSETTDASSIRGSEDNLKEIDKQIYQAQVGDETIQIDVNKARQFQPSYNIAPTNTTVIIYMNQSDEVDYNYVMECLKFGMVPFWSKPSRELKDSEDGWTAYRKEIGAIESKYFNCRKETIAKGSGVWNSSKRFRCVIPIQGYYEWHKEHNKNEKIPYFIHSKNLKLVYFAGMYSHNTNFKAIANINDQYLSSFTIVTGPATKSDSKDISWLHPRKPILLEPGSREWFDWLNPDQKWLDDLLDTSLNTETNKAFDNIDVYPVSKDVGPTKNNGEYLMKPIAKTQSSITLFFMPKKPKRDEEEQVKAEKQVKEEEQVKAEEKTKAKKRIKAEEEEVIPKKRVKVDEKEKED